MNVKCPLARALAVSVVMAVTGAASGDSETTVERAMLAGRNGWATRALFTVGESVSGYRPPGKLDGLGAYVLNADTVRVLANHELSASRAYGYSLANGARLVGARISYFDFDRHSRELCGAGLAYDTVYDRRGRRVAQATQINEEGDSRDGFARFCSAQLIEPRTFGFEDRILFSGEEVSVPSHEHGGSIWALDVDRGELWACPELGRGQWESVTPLATGSSRHVAMLLGDDVSGAPLYLWVGKKRRRGGFLDRNGLSRGKLYVWTDDSGDRTPQLFNGVGASRAGRFVRVKARNRRRGGAPGHDASGFLDDDELRDAAVASGAFRFARPEDLHTNPLRHEEAVLAATGSGGDFPTDTWGTIYRVEVDFDDIRRPGARLTILYDGDGLDQPDSGLRSPDNLVWSEDGFVYVQEDPATSGFGQTSGREASIWAIDHVFGDSVRIAEMDRGAVAPAGSTDNSPGSLGEWESSGIIDVTRWFRTVPGERLLLSTVQAHSIEDGPIGGNDDLDEGGPLVLLATGSK